MITKKLVEVKNALETAIELHDKMSNSYFCTPPGRASARRSYEKHNSYYYDSYYGLILDCNTTCSCDNVYYRGHFEFDGKKTTIRKIKNLYDAIAELV